VVRPGGLVAHGPEVGSGAGSSALLEAAVGVHGEPAAVGAVVRGVVGPGPATEAGALVVGERLADLGSSVVITNGP
jgi:hypothetical protein